jgi:uncharacterized protein YbjT (DUF2867 family)
MENHLNQNKILLTGASGFIGRHIVEHLLSRGFAVRCLVRRQVQLPAPPNTQDLLETAVGDITEPSSLTEALSGVHTVVHLVGIIRETPRATFQRIHVEGTGNLLAAATRAGVKRFFYMSGLGARPKARSRYHQTKWEAEELVRASGLQYVIFRPSVVFGPRGDFVNTLVDLVTRGPIIPIVGDGRTPMQPVWIGDLVQAVEKTLTSPELWNQTWEIGGPNQLSFEEMIDTVAEVLGIRKPKLHIPIPVMRPAALMLQFLTPNPPITLDQLIMLQEPNICDPQTLPEKFGIDPVGFRDGLLRYLRRN